MYSNSILASIYIYTLMNWLLVKVYIALAALGVALALLLYGIHNAGL